LLPFIAICAASAPLLGLLGTVTGIISTFKLITVFGSGDVKTLSGGISEALITTEFGLIVAIPSLLLHAFLSRKARGVIGQMETAAVAFVNQVSKSAGARAGTDAAADEPAVSPAAAQVADPEAAGARAGETRDSRPEPEAAGRADREPAASPGSDGRSALPIPREAVSASRDREADIVLPAAIQE
jgi:hypothetical protein